MANDPYYNNTVLLLHGDNAGDPYGNYLVAGSSFKSRTPELGTVLDGGGCAIGTYAGYAAASFVDSSTSYLGAYGSTGAVFDADFTVEFFVYLTSHATDEGFFTARSSTTDFYGACGLGMNGASFRLFVDGTGMSGGSALSLNTWHHIAITRAGSSIAAYVDGVRIIADTRAPTSSYATVTGGVVGPFAYTGHGFNGYATDLRIYKGVAKYTGATCPPPARPMPPYTSVIDSSRKKRVVAAQGAALTPYAAAYKYGGGCFRFDGTVSSYVSVPASTDFAFGTADFTIELWMNPTVDMAVQSNSVYIMDAGGNFVVAKGGAYYRGLYFYSVSIVLADEYDLAAGTWYHVAISRVNGTVYTFLNGVLKATVEYATAITAPNALRIGGDNAGTAGNYFNGLIDDIRVTNGVGRYTANFTPPTLALPDGQTVISGTVRDSDGALCSRRVNVHSRATGRLLGTAESDPVTGVYSIGAAETCYVVVLDSTGDYDALILDRIDPVT